MGGLRRVTENRKTRLCDRLRYSVDGAIYYFRNHSSIAVTLTLNLNLTLTLNLTLMECLKFDSLLNTHFKTPKPA